MVDEERYSLHQRLAEHFGERAGEALYTFVSNVLRHDNSLSSA